MKILITFLFILGFIGSIQAKEIPANSSGNLNVLWQVDKMMLVPTAEDLKIKLFETSAGDPAMNGNRILLSIAEITADGEAYVWETGINMMDVTEVKEATHHSFLIKGTEHYMDAESKIQKRPVQFRISYSFSKGHLNSKINVERMK